MTCKDCIHAEVCGLRAQTGEHAEQCEHFFKQIPKPHGRLIDVTTLKNKIESDYCNKCADVEECGVCVCQNCGVDTLFDDIDAIPTIVEAEEKENES